MRHYSLIPVRYNDQQLLVRCASIDAELWSIQWLGHDLYGPWHWFADCAPLEYETATAIVSWLNEREVVLNATPIREESTP